MPLNTTVEGAQANLYQLLNQLDDATLDKVIVSDGGSELFQIVTWAVYQAADPGGAAVVREDVTAAYTQSPSAYSNQLYNLVKKMRDAQAAPDAQKARATITCVPKANLIDGETVVLTGVDGTVYTFEFDVAGDGVGGGNIQVNVSADVTAIDVAVTLAGVIDATGDFAATPSGALVYATQDDPGAAGNIPLAETVADGGFLVSGFSGGTDGNASAGVIGLKNSKNDAEPRAVLVPADHAAAINL